jgi:hypothetical protein
VSIKLEKGITTDIILNRIKKVINSPDKVLFAFDQCIVDTKSQRTNYIGKAVKEHPELERFQYYSLEAHNQSENIVSQEEKERKIRFEKTIPVKESVELRASNDHDKILISNMADFWYKNDLEQKIEYIDFKELEDIIAGMSKRYAFKEANIIFEDIDWFDNGEVGKEHILKRISLESMRCLCSNIFFTSFRHWSGKRFLFLDVCIELPIPDAKAKKLPKLPEKVMEKLSCLGKPSLGKCFVELGIESEELKEKKEKLKLLKYEDLHKQVPFVYDELMWGGWHDTVEAHLKLKDVLNEVFKPLGYRYNTKLSHPPNEYTITKLTKNNNLIRVFFMMSSFHSNFQVEFYYEGINWSKQIRCALDKAEVYSGYFKDEENLRCILENVLSILEFLEAHIFPECDEIMGGSPTWYKHY